MTKKLLLPPSNKGFINILTNLGYDNKIIIAATNTDTLSAYLKTNIIYISGSEKPKPNLEFTFPMGIPLWILEAGELTINGQTVKILGQDQEQNTIQFLGAKFIKDGLNILSNGIKKVSYWQEKRKLIQYPQPYKNSFALIASIDDYQRNEDP